MEVSGRFHAPTDLAPGKVLIGQGVGCTPSGSVLFREGNPSNRLHTQNNYHLLRNGAVGT
jgi:hypothetical protein